MSSRPPWEKDEHWESFDPRDPILQWEHDWMIREIQSSIMTPEEFLRQTAIKSSGRAGEDAAEYWFKSHGWNMVKVSPPSRVAKIKGRLQVIYTGKGYPDYMGYWADESYDARRDGLVYNFRACEIKEAKPCEGDSVPHSRLSKSQRDFMADLPEGSAYVGILWRDGTFEVFPFNNERGSYRKDTGLE